MSETAKENVLLGKLESNEAHKNEVLVDSDVRNKWRTLKKHAYLEVIMRTSSRALITTNIVLGSKLSQKMKRFKTKFQMLLIFLMENIWNLKFIIKGCKKN